MNAFVEPDAFGEHRESEFTQRRREELVCDGRLNYSCVHRPKASMPLRVLCPSAFVEGVGAMSGGWVADRGPGIPRGPAVTRGVGTTPPTRGCIGDRRAPGVVVMRADASCLRLFASVRLSVVPPKADGPKGPAVVCALLVQCAGVRSEGKMRI